MTRAGLYRLFKPVFGGHGTYAEPAADVPNDCLIFWTLSMKNLVQRRRLSEAHPGLPDVLTAVYGLHVLSCILQQRRGL